MTDEYPSLAERCAKLAGKTTYRVPVEGVGTKFDHVPDTCALTYDLCGARGEKWNPGPELIYAHATGSEAERSEVIDWLAEKMRIMLQIRGHESAGMLRGIATISYCMVVRGDESVQGFGFSASNMKLARIGASWLEACVDETEARSRRSVSSPVRPRETA